MDSQKELLESFQEYLRVEGFSPGDRLPNEIDLAERFGVSRGTLREVIIHLGFLGILERSARRGTYVKEPSISEIGGSLAMQFAVAGYGFEELKEARLALELSQVGVLIKRMTPSTLDQLTELIALMEAAVDKPLEADRLDMRFHLALIEVTGNRPLMIFSHLLSLIFKPEHRAKFLNATAARKSVADHRAMLKAIRGEDKGALSKLIRQHIKPL